MNIAILAMHLSGGVALGVLYFGSLWWNAGLYGRARGLRTLVASIAARFVLLGGVLTAVSLEGAVPLLVTACGTVIARVAVLRWARVAVP